MRRKNGTLKNKININSTKSRFQHLSDDANNKIQILSVWSIYKWLT